MLAEFRRALSGEAFLGGGELSGLQLETHYAPILDPAGVVSGAVGLALDVSERKRHEETIARTVQFEKQLIGIVSHDLRNPISAIALGASLLMRRRQELDAASLRTVTRIQNAAQRVTLLIHDLLDFTQARLGNGIRVQPAPVALDEVVREAVEELESAHPGRKISLSIEGDLRGEWDAGRVGQVVANLGSNALKYSPPESMVKVALAGDGDWITLAVHNGGDPIPSDLQTAIFQPMVRGMDEDSSGRSVGLGLYIVKQIVEAHGGAVGVRSDAQTGTTFTVRLPRIAARAVA